MFMASDKGFNYQFEKYARQEKSMRPRPYGLITFGILLIRRTNLDLLCKISDLYSIVEKRDHLKRVQNKPRVKRYIVHVVCVLQI